MGRRRPRLDISKKNVFPSNRPRRPAEFGGKTPPSPGRREPVDSPEDRRFSNRSKSRHRCRHAMETSHGRSDGRSDAGSGSRLRLGTAGEAPHCGSRTPDIAVFLVRDFAKITFSTTGATRTPTGDRRLRSRAGAGTGYGTQATASRYIEEKKCFSWNRPRRSAELGGKTPPSPGRRVPVDSPEDRRFSNRSKASPLPARHGNFARTFRRTFRRRRWQQGPTRNGGGSSSLWESHSGHSRFSGTGFRKNHFFDYRRETNAGRRPPLAVSCRGRHRLWDAGDCFSIYRRKFFSPGTDLDDRPSSGGKTPPSPRRRVPVDSPEDRRFSNRSKSRRRCRHAMETSHGRSDGRSDAGSGSRLRLGTAGEAPHCGSRTPDIAVFLVRDFAKITFSTTGATRTPTGDRRLRSRACAGTGYGTQATASRYLEENFFPLEPTSTTCRVRRQDPALARATRAGR